MLDASALIYSEGKNSRGKTIPEVFPYTPRASADERPDNTRLLGTKSAFTKVDKELTIRLKETGMAIVMISFIFPKEIFFVNSIGTSAFGKEYVK